MSKNLKNALLRNKQLISRKFLISKSSGKLTEIFLASEVVFSFDILNPEIPFLNYLNGNLAVDLKKYKDYVYEECVTWNKVRERFFSFSIPTSTSCLLWFGVSEDFPVFKISTQKFVELKTEIFSFIKILPDKTMCVFAENSKWGFLISEYAGGGRTQTPDWESNFDFVLWLK